MANAKTSGGVVLADLHRVHPILDHPRAAFALTIITAVFTACTTADDRADADSDAAPDADVEGEGDSSVCPLTATNEVDLLVVWPDTHFGRMIATPLRDAVGALAAALPLDTSVHVGVASADMGTGLDTWGEQCIEGHDGVLLPSVDGAPFAEGGPEVISEHLGQVLIIAPDDACLGIHMFLDATVRALIDQAAPGQPNEGFLRTNSVLVVLYLGYHDDCSTDDPLVLDPTDETLGSFCGRCGLNPDRLRPVSPYVEALRALRPGCAESVVVGGFLGVPVGWSGELDAPELAPTPNEDPMSCNLEEVCEGVGSFEYIWSEPMPRLAQLAVELEAVELVSSLCDADYEGPLTRIGQRVVAAMGR